MSWAYFPPGHVLSSEMDKHPFETYICVLTIHHHRYKSRHIATSHSPSTVLDSTSTHSRRTSKAAHHIKTNHSPSRRSIPQAPSGDARQWQQTTSKPAIPHLDARFQDPCKANTSHTTPRISLLRLLGHERLASSSGSAAGSSFEDGAAFGLASRLGGFGPGGGVVWLRGGGMGGWTPSWEAGVGGVGREDEALVCAIYESVIQDSVVLLPEV